jgi:secreted PhoX family phosphatase
MIRISLAALIVAASLLPAHAEDFGVARDQMLTSQTLALFGIESPLTAGAPASAEEGYRTLDQTAADQLDVAPGLTADFLTRTVADSLDMMAFWPSENPTHLIGCIEGDREEIVPGKYNPSVQSISLADGSVTTLLRGMVSCDGIRTSPWGTIIATEEEDDGGVYEIIDPLAIKDVVLKDRATGEVSDPAHVAKRGAMAVIAWEGFAITPEGVVYGGDELRPGTGTEDADGGAIFKFIPATLHTGAMIAALDQSPLVAGKTYAMQVACQGDSIQFGQGCEIGKAAWIEIDPAKARTDAELKGATGYYRPEDLHADPVYKGPGIRFCGANTGNEEAHNYAEVICTTDLAPAEAPQADADGNLVFSTEVNRFVEGDLEFNSFDNLDFQPKTGILYVIEDHPNGEIYACLPDGADRDIKTDGCVHVFSVKDTSAEPTGFIFAPDGLTAYVSIQHSDDTNVAKLDDYGTDDLVRITGFKAPAM